ncbi:DUF971 domain-containing protein [Aurantimonas sp. 22II-16-19i]|uniref:gamma-butyrobetaine hydroxylase-like domain-containing protein n=1 Tax=Aurantimonas sp. 22II-16-19i TaxID=1317114 RepID=UPI0009F800B8|nr:DUF971 domain-containing protein [Aurantimonas sp. 22II-16-19i]ORE97813.1 hypothetical protein ATO4_07735 [Aurantimonas sp. 22II-16-19i]
MNASIEAPSELRVAKDRRLLTVVWPDGARDEFSAEMLRVLSPSAEVRGHSEADRKTMSGKRDVTIADLQPIGHYAIRIVFSDGHDSGLFSWSYLSELGRDKDARWQGYLDELKAKGLRREP